MAPFMPNTALELKNQLGLTGNKQGYIPDVVSIMLPPGHVIGKPKPLFSKIDEKQISVLRKTYAGKQSSDSSKTIESLDNLDKETLESSIAKQVVIAKF